MFNLKQNKNKFKDNIKTYSDEQGNYHTSNSDNRDVILGNDVWNLKTIGLVLRYPTETFKYCLSVSSELGFNTEEHA